MSQLNPNETQCADFEARFCCPALTETESSQTNVYDTTTALYTNIQFEPTARTDEYFTKFFDETTETFESRRWSFVDFNLTEPAKLDELRNLIKYQNASRIEYIQRKHRTGVIK